MTFSNFDLLTLCREESSPSRSLHLRSYYFGKAKEHKLYVPEHAHLPWVYVSALTTSKNLKLN